MSSMSELLGITLPSFYQVAGAIGISYGMASIVHDLLNKKTDKNMICKFDELNSLFGEGVLCSKNIRLSMKQSFEHILEICPSGGGKSRRFIMHNVNKLNKCSMIVTDPSGEIYQTCRTDKKEYILNPFNDKSIGYNPLQNCKSEFEVRKIASVILINGMNSNSDKNDSNQKSWVSMATPLLSSYMLMNYHTKKYNFSDMIRNICTMPIEAKIVTDDKGKVIKALKSIELEIIMSKVDSAIVEFESFKQGLDAKQTIGSIRTVMNSCLQLFFDSNVKNVLNRPNINLSKIRKEQSIVYIQIPERHSDYYSPLVATFLVQMFDSCLDNKGLPIFCLFDEFANIGIIPSISQLLATARKHEISIVAAVQNINQLKKLYGEVEAKDIIESFKTLLVCGGLRDSAEYISDILGNEEYIENETTRTKPLMTADEIRRLDKNKLLIICNNKRPVIDDMMEIVV